MPSDRVVPNKVVGMHNVDVLTSLMAQMTLLTKQLQNAQVQSARIQNARFTPNAIQSCPSLCDFCNGPHQSSNCQLGNPFAQMSME